MDDIDYTLPIEEPGDTIFLEQIRTAILAIQDRPLFRDAYSVLPLLFNQIVRQERRIAKLEQALGRQHEQDQQA